TRRVTPADWKPDFFAVKRTRPRLVGRTVKRATPHMLVLRGRALTPAPTTLTFTPFIQFPLAFLTVMLTVERRCLRRLPLMLSFRRGSRLSDCAGEKSPTFPSASTPAIRQ